MMMRTACTFGALAIACQVGILAQGAPTAAEFSAADPQQKRSMLRIVDTLFVAQADALLLEVVEQGLRDPDVRVRRESAAILSKAGHGPLASDVAALIVSSPTFQQVLLERLEDTDMALRGVSVDVLATVIPVLTDDVRSRLVSLFAREPEPMVRRALIAGLTEKALERDDVRDLTTVALNDEDGFVRRRAVTAAARLRLASALSLIAAALDLAGGAPSDPDPLVTDAFVDALAGYGAQASPYLEVLKARLAVESRPEGRERLRQAIAAIERSQAQE